MQSLLTTSRDTAEPQAAMLQHGGSSSLRLLLDEVTSPAAAAAGTAAAVPSPTPEASNGIKWTAATVFWTLGVFLLAGLAEIGGGWCVWQGIRNAKPWWYILIGCLVLVAYGFIPTLQPEGAAFARVYAVYGGIFIALSYAWGWALDGDRPDTGDWVGAAVAVAGVAVAWFWPR